jgi:glycosyltransferase involved in cell wall biosynthesis
MSRDLVLVANARLPGARAQAIQVTQAAAAFQRLGTQTTLLHAERRDQALASTEAILEQQGVQPAPGLRIRSIPCSDWIDRVPRILQYAPARLQELSFARNAARRILTRYPHANVLSRELETARHLIRAGHVRTHLELHRVPGGATRRRWLLEAAAGCRHLFAISGGVQEDLLSLGVDPTKITIEHDAHDPALFAELPDQATARAELGLDPDRQVVVYTGGLLAWKGVDVLIAAASELPEVQILIAGGMPADVERARAQAAGLANVRIDGFQPPARVPLYLAAADVGVLPNRSQPKISAKYTSPLKAFEYMAAGLPIVASDLPSLREILQGDSKTTFVHPDDPGDLGAHLRECLVDGGGRSPRGAEFTWEARAERILMLFG